MMVTPFYVLITGMSIGAPGVFVVTMVSGCIGLAGAATIIAALAAKAMGELGNKIAYAKAARLAAFENVRTSQELKSKNQRATHALISGNRHAEYLDLRFTPRTAQQYSHCHTLSS